MAAWRSPPSRSSTSYQQLAATTFDDDQDNDDDEAEDDANVMSTVIVDVHDYDQSVSRRTNRVS